MSDQPCLVYLQGDATNPQHSGNKIIIHVCNNIGGWGSGFVVALSKKWWTPEHDYREWYRGHIAGMDKPGKYGPFELGAVQFVYAGNNITVANMIAQHDTKWHGFIPPIRYKALESCLNKVATKAKATNATVHIPNLIGCGLAGGHKDIVIGLIEETLIAQNIRVFIYTLPA